MLNSINLMGRLVRDPELRYTTAGKAVAKFTIAVNEKYSTNGNVVEHVSYIPCEAWGVVAENLAKYCQKGREIIVSGALRQERWDVQFEDGSKGTESRIIIRASQITYLGTPANAGEKAAKAAPKKKKVKTASQPAVPVDEAAATEEMPPYAE